MGIIRQRLRTGNRDLTDVLSSQDEPAQVTQQHGRSGVTAALRGSGRSTEFSSAHFLWGAFDPYRSGPLKRTIHPSCKAGVVTSAACFFPSPSLLEAGSEHHDFSIQQQTIR